MKTRMLPVAILIFLFNTTLRAQDTIGLAEPPEVYYHNKWVDTTVAPLVGIKQCGTGNCAEMGKGLDAGKGISVYGIAAVALTIYDNAIDVDDPVWMFSLDEIYDTSLSNTGEYYRLYKKTSSDTADTVVMDIIAEARMNVLDSNVVGYFDRGMFGYYNPEYERRYLPIRGAYFEEPIEVTDSFFVGMTQYRTLHYQDINEHLWRFRGIRILFMDILNSSGTYIDEIVFRHWVNYQDTSDFWGNEEIGPWQISHSAINKEYLLIFPLLGPRPMYASPLVSGGNMDAPVVTVDDFVSVSPNPATGMATVKSSFGINAVELYDLGGALLLSQAASGLTHTLDLRPYAAGVYILKVRTPNGTATKKIVKQ